MAIDLLALKMSLFTEPHKRSTSTLLENYLASPELDFKDVIGAVCDFLLAGIDTVCASKIHFLTLFYILTLLV